MHLQKQYIFDTNVIQSEYAFVKQKKWLLYDCFHWDTRQKPPNTYAIKLYL